RGVGWGLRRPPATITPLPAGDCPKPPRFVFAEPPVPLEESYAVGTSLRYRCRPGYRMAGGKSPMVTCLPSSLWSVKSPDFCIGGSCDPPDIMNGRFDSETDLVFGVTITYSCDVGYQLLGQPYAQCVVNDNGVFWNNVPICASIYCSPPAKIENGQFSNGDRDFTFGMSVTYSCNEGFALIGDATIHCTVTDDNVKGIWSGPVPECKVVRCENPEVKNGRRLSGFGTVHTYKDTVRFGCNPGHLLNGSSVVICEADNTWKPSLPTCDPMYCGPAPHLPFAEGESAVGDSSLAGTTLKYRCKPGYTAASGKSSVVTCLSDRTWSADPDFCIKQKCTPPTIENGVVIAADFLFGTVVRFTCDPGYELKKASSAKCVVSGNGVDWDTALPYCERQLPDVHCAEPPTIDNGMHNGTDGTSFVQGSTVVFKCKDGFTLAGVTTIRCEVDHLYRGVWSKPVPECRG
ncbi:C4BPA protein, partial [Anhinga anhinga]|nr:C4BPA protein [Anhinga anhinga]